MSAHIWRAAAAAAASAGARLAQARGAAMAADVGAAFPAIEAVAEAERVVLRAPGLRARLFGTRRRGPDLRLVSLLTQGSRR
ncbi:MAG: hypothetical protein DCF31_01095 [Alphaproteobacteria bacterium]|nr:MAG: hypothetical protein DCF31_01095 [Alphaproteobacteria bacterium]